MALLSKQLRHFLPTLLATAVLIQATLLASTTARAADFPSRTITIISPTPPGGLIDSLARVAAEGLQAALGQPVIVDYKPGASTMIATQYVARSAPDGHTLLLSFTSFLINPLLNPKAAGYDPIKGFVPVTHLADISSVLVAGTGFGVNSIEDYVAYAKAHPGQLSFGTVGTGTPAHIFSKMFDDSVGAKLLVVPYKGETPAMTDILGNSLHSAFVAPNTYRAQISTGKVRALAVTGTRRIREAPAAPTFAEAGIAAPPQNWFGVLAPAGTPPEVINKLSIALESYIRQPQVRARLVDVLGVSTVDSSQQKFAAKLQGDYQFWKSAITKYQITAE
jgi:tripartite-type tricarboxylate transporter receptor subunit TctC